jgi:ABC-type polysaccharide/polyol phosphate transport system ATPase subunit
MSELAATVEQVWKRFSRRQQVRTLADVIAGLPQRLFSGGAGGELGRDEFWALQDLSFQLARGETLGIVGLNGAGKSTVLKLLFRILRPDRGSVTVNGRVGGLIELGAGFHPMLSGRENVFINGAILGMRKKDIRAKYDSIVEFAELADFMDMPVKNYSSGMFARLAFSVSAHAEPEVLLVDEVLAVGDAPFQVKCYDWMGKTRQRGCSVVMVSHAMNVMGSADRVLYLDHGKARRLGDPRTSIDEYLAEMASQRGTRKPETAFARTDEGRPRAEIEGVEFVDATGATVEKIEPGTPIVIRFRYRLHETIESPILALTLFHDDPRFAVNTPGHYLFHVFSGDLLKGSAAIGEGLAEVEVDALHLPVGVYRAKTYFFERDGNTLIFAQDNAATIEITRPGYSDGRAMVDHRQKWRSVSPSKVTGDHG